MAGKCKQQIEPVLGFSCRRAPTDQFVYIDGLGALKTLSVAKNFPKEGSNNDNNKRVAGQQTARGLPTSTATANAPAAPQTIDHLLNLPSSIYTS
jgi:hypothetical protein